MGQNKEDSHVVNVMDAINELSAVELAPDELAGVLNAVQAVAGRMGMTVEQFIAAGVQDVTCRNVSM